MLYLDFIAASVALFIVYRLFAKNKRALPPGPKGLPIIGNIRGIPTSFEWKTYHKWSKELDTDILYLNIAGQSIVVLDTVEAATELLEKRSSIYSGRARLPMINELMGWEFNVAFMPYGERWRKNRRLMHHAFQLSAVQQFRPHSLKAARNLLRRFLEKPDDIMGNIRNMAGETIMSIVYGLHTLPENDPYINTAQKGVHPVVIAAVPGAFLVDALPFLKYVPEWVPGAGFQKKAREWKKWARDMVELPYEAAKRNIAAGVSPLCFVSLSLERKESGTADDAYREDIIQGAAGTLYGAGSDTTVAAIASCILGLLDRPDVLKRAQQELDSVVKPGHMPDFDDEASLPFITAIVKETMRWRDVAPIAIPHYLDVEDEYKGYRIPASSVIIANAWAMLHDERVYPDPFKFKPERFMRDGKFDKQVLDPDHACWGFGRRVCPGRYMAYSSVWMAVASLIYVFDIEKSIDENGHVIEPSHEYISAISSAPKPYKCTIKPRSPEAEVLIRTNINPDI